jgi:2-oxoglutarate dehydrogenase E2 component (dihydrolipoamide succinyltransferase)
MSIVEVKIPNVGESVTEATIGKWFKNNGDYVALDEILVELETDKATQEFPAEAAGVLKILAQEGDVVQIGQVIAQIDTSASGGNAVAQPAAASTKVETTAAAPAPSAPQPTGQILQMNVPAVGESITEVTIGSWLKNDGDIVQMDEILCEIESDKATFELTSEAQGKLKIMAKAGEVLEIGAPICQIEVMEGVISSTTPQNTTAATTPPVAAAQTAAAAHGATPVAANILAEKGISPDEIQGSGARGKVTKKDALGAQKAQNEAPQAQPALLGERREERKKLTPLRKTISKRLVAVKNETAMLTTFNEVDMKPIMDIRKKYKDAFKDKYDVGLGFMSFFTKAVCEALKAWPAVGAQIDGDEIVYHDYCDISIAVSAPKGLVVPVIRNAETMSFDQIEKEIVALATKARDGKLSIEEMSGGTFTITNGGIFGSMLSTPIINAPQAAILGMHNIVERPVAVNGQVEIRPIMYVALSYDHRIIDGRESVSFLKMVKELLEDPTRLLLGI